MRRALAVLAPFALAACTFHFHVHEAPREAAPAADARVSPVAGAWHVRGRNDRDHGAWSATLVLEEGSGLGSGEGWFDWLSEHGAQGRELVRWEHDAAAGTLRLQGYELENARGIGVGSYVAEVAPDGRSLVNGRWGPPSTPGTWEATR